MNYPFLRYGVVLLLASIAFCSAATTTVTSISALQSAINSATAGDTIIVKNGAYTTAGSINISRQGTPAAPILITAETIGGVTISGSAGFKFSSPAAWVTVRGFVLKHAGGISIPFGTSHCRLSRNVIELAIPAGSDVSYVNISGDDVEIDRNELRNKSTLGEMLDIAGSGSQVAQRLWVHHNYFHDFKSPGGNGAETIRWGLSGLSLSDGEGVCEYNLFVRCDGENELISNKSGGNTYRYNTFLDSSGDQLTLRHGNDCLVYGNYFKNTAGLRVYGDRHLIHSNYFEGNSLGIDMGNGDGNVEDGAALTSHDRPEDCVVVFNTFVNNATHYQMGGRTNGLGALNVTFANNILQGGTRGVSISSSAPYTGTWSNNFFWNVPTIGNIPASGYAIVDPQLVPDDDGVLHIAADSPAIGAAVGNFPAVNFDQDGQLRDSFKDVGADEFSAAQITAHPLTPSDVGPNSSSDEPPPPPALVFEAENLAFAATGASTTIVTETSSSGGAFASNSKYVTLNADGIPPPSNGEFIEFTLPNIPRGTYDLLMRYKTNSSARGIARVSIDGVALLDVNEMSSSTFRETTIGTVHLTAGTHVVRLAVVGRSPTATSYVINADRFTLVPDGTDPVIGSLPDLVVEATGPGGATATYSGAAFDEKDGALPVVFTPPSGSLFPLGASLVVATAQDFSGNTAASSFEVHVVDTRPPLLFLPASIVAEATGPDGAVVNFSATAEDLVSGSVPVQFDRAPGSVFPLGTTTVNATAADAAGNVATGSFNVTVRDTTAPAIVSLSATPGNLGAPNHTMIAVTILASVHDAVDAAPRTRIVAVTSNEPINGPGDGNTAPDWEITGDLTLNLRAERSGLASDRVYTITVESRDATGNASTGTVQVIVPHNRG
jgi:hypothetical protein